MSSRTCGGAVAVDRTQGAVKVVQPNNIGTLVSVAQGAAGDAAAKTFTIGPSAATMPILNDTALESLIPAFQAKGVGIINASATGMGLLTERGAPGWHPAPEEWCVKEVIGHLIEAERRVILTRARYECARLSAWAVVRLPEVVP